MDEIRISIKPRGLEMDTDRKNFALALKTWRLREGLTQERAGRKLGVSRYTVMRAEQAKDITWESAYKMFSRLTHYLVKEGRNDDLMDYEVHDHH